LKDSVLQAALEPTRRAILHLIAEQEMSSSDIAAKFEITAGAVSQHLRALLDAGLVTVREAGTRRMYAADQDSLKALLEWLDAFWSVGLSKLKVAAESGKDVRTRRTKRP
jgi:DNA-binding transcriptional ArsR family regulator